MRLPGSPWKRPSSIVVLFSQHSYPAVGFQCFSLIIASVTNWTPFRRLLQTRAVIGKILNCNKLEQNIIYLNISFINEYNYIRIIFRFINLVEMFLVEYVWHSIRGTCLHGCSRNSRVLILRHVDGTVLKVLRVQSKCRENSVNSGGRLEGMKHFCFASSKLARSPLCGKGLPWTLANDFALVRSAEISYNGGYGWS